MTPKQTIQVLMMNREDEYHYIMDRDISCTVVRLPYQGNATALLVLPNEGKMQQVENGLNEGALKNWLKTATKRYFLSRAGATSLHPCLGRLMAQDNTGMGSDGRASQAGSCLQTKSLPVKSSAQDLAQLEG